MNKKLYVGNLDYNVTGDQLKELFTQAGTVVNATVISWRSGRSKGFGFVEMGSDEEAQKAIEMFDGKQDYSQPLSVAPARPKPAEVDSKAEPKEQKAPPAKKPKKPASATKPPAESKKPKAQPPVESSVAAVSEQSATGEPPPTVESPAESPPVEASTSEPVAESPKSPSK